MAGTIPVQERVVDPFASYGSNVVNKITQIVTHESEGMLTVPSLQVELDSISPETKVVVKPGYVIKDDVLIRITTDHIVDFSDFDNWFVPPDIAFGGGYCYLVLKYEYLKVRPAPQATIRILQPDDRLELTTDPTLLLLKVVRVDSSPPHDIISLHDYDPSFGYEQNERKYIKYYAGGVTRLDETYFNQVTDQGRIAYESDRDKFFFGHSNEWRELTAGGVSINVNTDTTGVFVGQLCYVDSNEQAHPAISTSLYTSADMIVTGIGQAGGVGQGIIAGYGENVPVEPGALIAPGDILYLSDSVAGTVTNVRPNTLFQIVGRSLQSANILVDMIFSPKIPIAPSVSGSFATWTLDGGSGLYYHDIDISILDGTSVFDCHWFDATTNKEITPADVEIRSGGDVLRVWSSINTITLNYMIQSPVSFGGAGGGGGGGGGTSDHSILLNLDYAASGHTGFAPSPHNNSHHSQTYITSTSVNFTTLNANGSVGTAGTQVAFGNHTHPEYIDIPSGEILLFESDTAVSGYSLLTDEDDGIVYFTKGSGAGGEAGGTAKSGGTWSQPNHSHGISSQAGHTHTTASHKLTYAEMPVHTHNFGVPSTIYLSPELIGGPTLRNMAEFSPIGTAKPLSNAGGSAAHNHGATGSAGSHSHGGSVSSNGTLNTWRPRGRNYTRQQRT